MAIVKSISLNDTVVQGKGNIVSNMGGEMVMLSVTKGKYYNLGETGGEIWEIINSPILISQIVDQLTSIYQIESSECQNQVIAFLNHLLSEGLIEKQ